MFEPTAIPQDSPPNLRAWLAAQLRLIANDLRAPQVERVRFAVLAAEPEKFDDGDVVMADGSNWNPGAGAGVYARVSGAWVKL